MASRLATVEYLTTTKIGEKGQLTVPKEFRADASRSYAGNNFGYAA